MYLHAENVTLDFPLAQAGHSSAPAPDSQPLGGRLLQSKRKAVVRALDDVSFQLEKGDRLALVGHNGSGKSTLLRVLAGIYQPDRGAVRSSSHVSGIFNMSLGFRPEASGYRNLVLKGLMAGRSRAEIDAALPEIAEFTGLGPYLDMPLHTYSQGMAMRLAFAATTAFANDILAMDEWIGAGDAAFQEKIIARMNDFLHASTIVVVASHSANLLRRLANKTIWLEQGRVRKIGGPELIDEYETSVSTWGLAAPLLETVRGGRGLWLHAPEGDAARLLWNVATNAGDLQLVLKRPDGSRQVVRPLVQRCGAWPLAPWAQAGMQFEIVSPREEDAFASLALPATA